MEPDPSARSSLADDPTAPAEGSPSGDPIGPGDSAALAEASSPRDRTGAGDPDAFPSEPQAPRASADTATSSPEARLQRALDLGYRHLGKRDRTEAEIRAHLVARDLDEPSIEGAVEALVRQGYLDDARYARTFAEDRRALDDWGPERIERRLLALGVAPELVADALSVRDGAGELEAAVALLHRRFGALPDSDRERDRALRMLARKGHDLELAYDAVRAFCGEGA
jgi:regulatory protein